MTIHACPACGTSLGSSDGGGELRAVCGTCLYGYRVQEGRVVERTASGIFLRRGTAPVAMQPVREVPAEVGHAGTELVSFHLPGRSHPVSLQRGDLVAVTYGMRGDSVQALLSIVNLETGQGLTLAAPGARSEAQALALSTLLGAVAMVLLLQAGVSPLLALVGSVGLGTVAWHGIRRLLTPRHRLSDADRERIASWQRMLDVRRDIETRRTAIAREEGERTATRGRLSALRERMHEVGLPSYASRIATIDAAVAMLDRQRVVDHALLRGYDRSIAILEIERESGETLHAFDAVSAQEMTARTDELRELEREHEEMARMVAANAEVEQLLRHGGPSEGLPRGS